MNIRIIKDSIAIAEVTEIAREFYFPMIKGVVDIKKEIIALGGEYHMDANLVLIQNGSHQQDIWGFNLHLEKPKSDWIEYTSLINIRPAFRNTTMEVSDAHIRDTMKKIINGKIV